MNQLEQYLEVSLEVREALAANKPVITLGSTIISHGMPYPQNVGTALKVEQIIRENGAVPATIAVIGGKLRTSLSKEEIDHLGKKGLDVTKASHRDLPVLAARGEDGATTVAATMVVVTLAGISVFATGGIGGVHRGAGTATDISADLKEPTVTPVIVICADAESILDFGLTVKYLETKGVSVLGYQMEELPAFYTRKSGFKVDYRINTPAELASIFRAKEDLNLKGDLLVINPIPGEFAMDRDYIAKSVDETCEEAHKLDIKGKDAIPYLLDKIQKITGGKSLDANIHLVYNNAALGAKAACELYRLE